MTCCIVPYVYFKVFEYWGYKFKLKALLEIFDKQEFSSLLLYSIFLCLPSFSLGAGLR